MLENLKPSAPREDIAAEVKAVMDSDNDDFKTLEMGAGGAMRAALLSGKYRFGIILGCTLMVFQQSSGIAIIFTQYYFFLVNFDSDSASDLLTSIWILISEF